MLFVSFMYIYWILIYKISYFYRAIVTLIYIVGIIFILFPNYANNLASVFEVGRGADLIMYFSLVTFTFFHLRMYSKNRKLEQDVTKIVRENAIQNVIKPKI